MAKQKSESLFGDFCCCCNFSQTLVADYMWSKLWQEQLSGDPAQDGLTVKVKGQTGIRYFYQNELN